MPRVLIALLFVVLVLVVGAGCGGEEPAVDEAPDGRSSVGGYDFPPAPVAPDGDLDPELDAALGNAVDSLAAGGLDGGALEAIAASGDPRAAWILADMMRFVQTSTEQGDLISAFEQLTGVNPMSDPSFFESPWLSISNHLIAWDLPAPPAYQAFKGRLFTALEPGWEPFFADPDANIDFRHLSWGGVLIDDRPEGATEPCERGCIPALDDPELTDADAGDWYPDERIVFGIELEGEAVALPRNIMEVHEMVNMTLAGRRLGIPYCTLCGSAQAYFTDRDQVGGEDLVLRTSGLLSRSNKVMYELASRSIFDTFTGEALSGPLRERGVELDQATVVTTTWGEWKQERPETQIIASDGGLGRDYPLDPLGDRDANGPIFPVGPVDERLGAQVPVLGVIAADGEAVAFVADAAREVLADGGEVSLDGVSVEADGGGLRALDSDGEPLATHESFWFAWSQFHPGTALWEH